MWERKNDVVENLPENHKVECELHALLTKKRWALDGVRSRHQTVGCLLESVDTKVLGGSCLLFRGRRRVPRFAFGSNMGFHCPAVFYSRGRYRAISTEKKRQSTRGLPGGKARSECIFNSLLSLLNKKLRFNELASILSF